MSHGIVDERHPLHAAILARPARRSVGVWFIAQTSTRVPYPCACRHGRRCTTTNSPHPSWLCTCWGRTDLHHLPAHCCARGAPPVTAAEQRKLGERGNQ